jgi:hypothetical protein
MLRLKRAMLPPQVYNTYGHVTILYKTQRPGLPKQHIRAAGTAYELTQSNPSHGFVTVTRKNLWEGRDLGGRSLEENPRARTKALW